MCSDVMSPKQAGQRCGPPLTSYPMRRIATFLALSALTSIATAASISSEFSERVLVFKMNRWRIQIR